MKFIVKYSKDKDIWNHLNTNWRFTFNKHGREDIKDRIRKSYPKKFIDDLWNTDEESEAKKFIGQYLDFIGKPLPIIARGVEQLLNENKDEIVERLEKVYDEKFPFEEITVYIHSCLFSPYSYEEKWFMSSRNNSEDGHINTALHELNHFMFYYYYPDLKDEIGQEKYETLKEALAVYTNPEGNDKPSVQNMENFFKQNLNKSIKEILHKEDWRIYL